MNIITTTSNQQPKLHNSDNVKYNTTTNNNINNNKVKYNTTTNNNINNINNNNKVKYNTTTNNNINKNNNNQSVWPCRCDGVVKPEDPGVDVNVRDPEKAPELAEDVQHDVAAVAVVDDSNKQTKKL